MIVALVFAARLLAFGVDTGVARDSVPSLIVPPWWEADVTVAGESFTSRLSAWQWHTAALRYRGKSASHGLEFFTARRFDRWNSGVAVEESRTVGRGAYVAGRAQFAPGATIMARSDLSIDWYQSVGKGWEIVPSARLMSFPRERVPILGVGLGRYTGLWYVGGRLSRSNRSGEQGVTTTAQVRRYVADASPDFFDATIAYGHDLTVVGPSTVGTLRTSSAALRGQRMISRRVGFSLVVTYDVNAALPDRRGGVITTFVRW